jgi:hypothetical protein
MTLMPKLIETAEGEWSRWGFSVRPLHAKPKIAGKENQAPYVAYVNDYWKAAGKPTWNGNTAEPWSAAFISFCFKSAGAGGSFPYAAAHVEYCRSIMTSAATYPDLALADPTATPLAVGDLLWAARGGSGCPTPPKSFGAAIAALHAGTWFCSHCDIVVELRPGEVDVMGGNVSDSVTMTTYTTANGQIHDAHHDWLAIIKNSL